MMRIDSETFSTTTIYPNNKDFDMMSSSSSLHHSSQNSNHNNANTSRIRPPPSSTDPPRQSTPIESAGLTPLGSPTDWEELKSMLSTDTMTVFPLLHSKSSVSSSQWHEASIGPRSGATSTTSEDEGEEEKKVEHSFLEQQSAKDLSLSHPRQRQPAPTRIHSTVWTFTDTPPLGDYKEAHDEYGDDDSSAALSMYLESKLNAALLSDDDKSTGPAKEQSNPVSDKPVSSISFEESARVDDFEMRQSSDENRPQSAPKEYSAESNERPQGPCVENVNTSATAQPLPPLQTPPPVPPPSRPMGRRQSAPTVVQKKRHPDHPSVREHSPPPPPVYNPVTGYSPGRAARKRIWGASNAHFLPSRGVRPSSSSSSFRGPTTTAEDDSHTSSSDVESFSSEEMLERWSAHIRAELRYAELVELAGEAERAAESGQESYAGRPWLYASTGEEYTDGALSPGIPLPNPIKRHASYSEGLPLPTSSLRATAGPATLPPGVRNLRDAEDVFPSFDNFHKNLRTHYLRCRVAETVLVFEEQEETDERDQVVHSPAAIDHADAFGAQGLMDSFSDILLRGGRSKDEEEGDMGMIGFEHDDDSADDDASNVGELLAEHIHSEDHPVRRQLHPMSLPGLPRLEATQPLSIGIAGRGTYSMGRRTIGRSASLEEDAFAKPRVLFPSGDTTRGLDLPELSWDDETSATPATPTHTEDSNDFVTPARLREIRRPKGQNLHKFVNYEQQSMILPANSVIQESPFRNTPVPTPSPSVRQRAPQNHRIPVRDLLLPAFSAGTEDEGESAGKVGPSRSCDSLEDEVAPNPLSAHDRALVMKMDDKRKTTPPPSTPPVAESNASPSSKSHSPVESLVLPSDDEIGAVTEVKLSIVDKSHDSKRPEGTSPARRIVRPSTILANRANPMDQKVFTMKRLVSTTTQGSFDGIDCRCLSPTMNDFHDLLEEGEDQRKRFQNKGHAAIAGAMKIFKKFSPARGRKIARTRDLFVHPRANDDFLQNYLYCTKDPQKEELSSSHDNACMTVESCDNTGLCGGGLSLGGYCGLVAREVDCAATMGGRCVRNNHSAILPLSFDPSKHDTTQADSWFDAATERVDGIIDNFIRGSTPRWDRFQPPSLRKIMRSEPRSSRRSITEPVEEEPPTLGSNSSRSDSRPSVQALFQHTESDLSDTQFALVYGTSRSNHQAATTATTSPLRDDVAAAARATSEPSHPVPLEIPICYSSSSDEDEERLALSASMTYISEPSL